MFKLEIDTGNSAFEDAGPNIEVARILRAAVDYLESGHNCRDEVSLFDINGNRVGRFQFTQSE